MADNSDQIKQSLNEISMKLHAIDIFLHREFDLLQKKNFPTSHEKNYDEEYKKYIGADFFIEKL